LPLLGIFISLNKYINQLVYIKLLPPPRDSRRGEFLRGKEEEDDSVLQLRCTEAGFIAASTAHITLVSCHYLAFLYL
jgi:hypothetical protein